MIYTGVDDMDNTKEQTISIIELTLKSDRLHRQALQYIKENQSAKAQACLKEGKLLLLEASKIHASLLSKDIEMNILLTHAEDLLISIQLYTSLMKEIIEVYQKFPTLKGS